MEQVKKMLRSMKVGREKEFLQDAVKKRDYYVKSKDVQMLESIISRLNGIYDGLSKEGQAIATELVKILMEDVKNANE